MSGAPGITGATARFLLSADDYAMSAGVCTAIERLAEARRLSATTAIVTGSRWPATAARLAELRERIAVGLHLNLTMGAPLGTMNRHAPDDHLPTIGTWIVQALSGRLDLAEIEAEFTRQIVRFEEVAGAPPDLIDGHHHIHALPGLRRALLRALSNTYPSERMPLLRVPGDRASRIIRRGAAVPKALFLAALSTGASDAFRAAGAPVNAGFAGFSGFRRDTPFATELARFQLAPGTAHLVMCHPGLDIAKTAATPEPADPVQDRRGDEFAALMAYTELPHLIHHPADWRDESGFISWKQHLGR